MKAPTIEIGDLVTMDGNEYEVLDTGPRNKFEKISVQLLGDGIIGLNLATQEKTYFLDFDIDYVKKKGTDQYVSIFPPSLFEE